MGVGREVARGPPLGNVFRILDLQKDSLLLLVNRGRERSRRVELVLLEDRKRWRGELSRK